MESEVWLWGCSPAGMTPLKGLGMLNRIDEGHKSHVAHGMMAVSCLLSLSTNGLVALQPTSAALPTVGNNSLGVCISGVKPQSTAWGEPVGYNHSQRVKGKPVGHCHGQQCRDREKKGGEGRKRGVTGGKNLCQVSITSSGGVLKFLLTFTFIL